MKVMILAAGEGRRMLPLTKNCPKPLLKVYGIPLLERWLQKVERANTEGLEIDEVIVNAAYLGDQIEAYIEQRDNRLKTQVVLEPYPLETGGALNNALPVLGDKPFLLINGDVYIDGDLRPLVMRLQSTEPALANLLLVNNPNHNSKGDFARLENGHLAHVGNVGSAGDGSQASAGVATKALTFAGLSVISPELIGTYPERRQAFPLREVFAWAIANKKLFGEIYDGFWLDVGTPERLVALEQHLQPN